MISEKEKKLRLVKNALSELDYITSCNVAGNDYEHIVNADHIIRELKEIIESE